MMIKFERFNTYFCLFLALLVAGGCETGKKKDYAAIELHLEVNSDGGSDNESITVFRSNPQTFNVEKNAFLDMADVVDAKVIDDMGGYKIQLKFNWRGTQVLGGMTAAHIGKRIGIYAVFGGNRWLAAPVITKQITDGAYTFTPDASREEADRIVRGLNAVAAALKKDEKTF